MEGGSMGYPPVIIIWYARGLFNRLEKNAAYFAIALNLH